MKEGYILVDEKHYLRWKVIELVETGRLTLREVAEKLGISFRQAKRIKQVALRDGPSGLSHGNRGRPPTSSGPVGEFVLELVNGLAITLRYDFNVPVGQVSHRSAVNSEGEGLWHSETLVICAS